MNSPGAGRQWDKSTSPRVHGLNQAMEGLSVSSTSQNQQQQQEHQHQQHQEQQQQQQQQQQQPQPEAPSQLQAMFQEMDAELNRTLASTQ